MSTRILLIEDEADLRDNVADLLELEGYEVMQAANGVAGLHLASEHRPDLVLCDVMMPELDGPGVLRHLRADPATQALPFIFLTAQAEAGTIRTGMNLGADDYLTKPFDDDELLRSVATRLARHHEVARSDDSEQLRHDLTQVVPHELRTPLVTILGCTQILRDDWADLDADFAAQLLDDVFRAGRRLERFVENFSLYAQLELAQKDSAARSALVGQGRVDAAHVLLSQAHTVAARHDRAGDLVAQVASGIVQIAPTLLAKLADELLDNAFKFSDRGTPVALTGTPDGDAYVLTIEDGGRGFTPEQRERVAAFVQFDRAAHEQQGLGLGLYLARALATLHGGTLTMATAAHATGTRATVRLPLG